MQDLFSSYFKAGGGGVSLTKEILCFAALFVVFKYIKEKGGVGSCWFFES